jgi:excisionase family DNA binding protein
MSTVAPSGPEFISVTQAAQALGVSGETVRKRLTSRELQGEQQANRRWRVAKASVDASLAKVGKQRHLPVGDLAGLAAELQRLSDKVDRLEEHVRESDRELERVRGERDRYRSDASTLRATALHVQAAASDAAGTLRTVLASLEDAQAQALSAMLAPGFPQDLGLD